jgi:hypothetical protein
VRRFLRSGWFLLWEFQARSVLMLFCRLESDVVVLRGPEAEASSQLLRGVVVLCLPSSLRVDDVHLRLTGQAKIG